MRCSACGARYQSRSARCPECGARQDPSPIETSPKVTKTVEPPMQELTVTPPQPVETPAPQARAVESMQEAAPGAPMRARPVAKKPRSLLEFPGVNRSAMPQWRKELGERVREVQERRAREAVLEAAEIGPLFSELDSRQSPVLELLPQAEMPPMNPLVVAALQRIERAHAQNGQNYSAATAIAYETQPEEMDLEPEPVVEEIVAKPERVHTLAVVPPPEPVVEENEAAPSGTRKPKRVIDGLNDPALNYLDKIPRSVIIESCEYRSAGLFRRLLGALVDLTVVGLLAAPVLALTELTNLAWENPRVIGFAVGTVLVIGFLYLTISVAFTGRTIGMKLCSLRVVDARNGLIPTGSQSAGRSLLYLLSLAGAGVLLLYTLVNAEHHTIHDHFTRTVVIRA